MRREASQESSRKSATQIASAKGNAMTNPRAALVDRARRSVPRPTGTGDEPFLGTLASSMVSSDMPHRYRRQHPQLPSVVSVEAWDGAELRQSAPERVARSPEASLLKAVVFACLGVLASTAAQAQSDDVVTPVELFDPDVGDGVRLSPAFVLYPQVTTEVAYDSNIYNLDTPAIDDAIVSIRPRLVVRSDFARHELRFEAGADIRRYIDTSSEDSEQYRINAGTLLELGSNIDVEGSAGYSRGVERRGTAGDALFTDRPVVFHEKAASLEISRAGNRLEIGVGGSVLTRDYEDATLNGLPLDLDFRDVLLSRVQARVDYRFSAKTEAFSEVGLRALDYDVLSAPNRDSDGFYGLIGVTHELSELLEVEAAVGYLQQDFDEPAFETAKEINYRLEARWTPKPDWRFTARAARDVDPSRVRDSAAVIASSFRLTAEHAVGDKLLLAADAQYLEEDYRGQLRQDQRITLAASATYRLADRIGVIAAASYRDQDGGDFGRTYDGFAVSIGVRASW